VFRKRLIQIIKYFFDIESNGYDNFIKWLELNTDIFKRSIKREVNDKIPEEKTFKETIKGSSL